MIELVLLACLVDKPESCRDVGLMYSAENLTPMQCLMQAPPHMAKLGRRASRLEDHEVDLPTRGTLRQDLATNPTDAQAANELSGFRESMREVEHHSVARRKHAAEQRRLACT